MPVLSALAVPAGHRRAAAGVTAAALTAALVATTVGAAPARADLGAPTRTTTVTVTRTPATAPQLVGIRTGQHAAYDRVVLDLRGAAPGYRVSEVRTAYADPSGRPVTVAGATQYVTVVLRPATAHRSDGTRTYTGARQIATSYPNLRGVVLSGDFENVVSVTLGLRHRAGFRVLTLANPTRVVVDVAH